MTFSFHKIFNINPDFEIPFRNIAGFRYRVRAGEITEKLTAPRWIASLFAVVALLICFIPNNRYYDFTWQDRVIFWPVMTAVFLAIFLTLLGRHASEIQKGQRRVFSTAYAVILATVLSTVLGNALGNYLSDLPIVFGTKFAINLLFNVFFVVMFELAHYLIFVLPRNKSRQSRGLVLREDWRRF